MSFEKQPNIERQPASEKATILIDNLRKAAESNDKGAIIEALSQIQSEINQAWGDEFKPMNKPYYDEGQERYVFSLSSGTAGTRFYFNINNDETFTGKFIFPNVALHHTLDEKNLAQAFEEVFGENAKEINNNPQEPYYVVDVIGV